MSVTVDNYQIEVTKPPLTFQSVDNQVRISLLETRIQILEQENARLQEALRFFLEIGCSDEEGAIGF